MSADPRPGPTIPLTIVGGGSEAVGLAARLAHGLRQAPRPERVLVIATAPPPAGRCAGEVAWRWIDPAAVTPELLDEASRTPGIDRVVMAPGVGRAVLGASRAALSASGPLHLDGIVATVDAVALATRLATGSALGSADELGLVAMADAVVVAGADRLVPTAAALTLRALRCVNRLGRVLAPALDPVDVGELADLDAWSGPPRVGPAPFVASAAVERCPDRPRTIVVSREGRSDPEAVAEWFADLTARTAGELWRVQGAVAMVGEPDRRCYRGSGVLLRQGPHRSLGWGAGSARSTVLIVGAGLDAGSLAAGFAATAAAPSDTTGDGHGERR